MRPVPVVEVEPLGQVGVPRLGARISMGVRPLVEERADEPLHLPVHPGRVGRSQPVANPQTLE